jgi:molybdopterin/thiamine biosynthesis adenylyltransferase
LSFYEQFDVVVFTDCYQVDAMTAINDHCRANNIGFIIGGCFGLYGYSFTDFGDNYKNFDKDGEQNRQCIVTSIT